MTAPKGSIFLTGANGGLGSAIVSQILRTPSLASNYTGLYAVRDANSASRLQSIIRTAPSSHQYETVDVDLGSIESVKKLAARINSQVSEGQLPKIRALILNAAYQEHTTMSFSQDGFDMTWQVNYLANFILVLLLLPSMDEQGRLLIIGSWTHNAEDRRNPSGFFDDSKWRSLFPGPEELAQGKFSTPSEDPTYVGGLRRYGASKLCALMLFYDLTERFARDPRLKNLSIVGLDPGGMASDLTQRSSFLFRVIISKIFMPIAAPLMVKIHPNGMVRPTWKSAADVLRACFELTPPKERFLYLNGSEECNFASDVKDIKKRKELWEYSIRVAQLEGEDTIANLT